MCSSTPEIHLFAISTHFFSYIHFSIRLFSYLGTFFSRCEFVTTTFPTSRFSSLIPKTFFDNLSSTPLGNIGIVLTITFHPNRSLTIVRRKIPTCWSFSPTFWNSRTIRFCLSILVSLRLSMVNYARCRPFRFYSFRFQILRSTCNFSTAQILPFMVLHIINEMRK